jgi:tetratricopeptide (TPR) repeat protein
LTLAERSGQIQIVVFAHNMIGEQHMEAGEFALGLPHMERAIAAAEQLQDPLRLAWQLNNFTWFLYFCGKWQRARETYLRAELLLREADPQGATWHAAVISVTPGMLALVAGHEDEGRRLLEEAIEHIERVGTTFSLDLPTYLLAEADLLADRAEAAQLRLMSFLQTDLLAPADSNALGALLLLAWSERDLGRHAQAEARLEGVLATARPFVRVDALRVRALIATYRERYQEAANDLDEAIALCQAMPYPYAEAKALWIYGRLEVARGDPAAARERFTAALAICDQLGEGLYAKHIERELPKP